jgi:hypothetical protein
MYASDKPSYIDFDKEKFRRSLKYYDLRGEIGVLSYTFSKKLSELWKFKTPELAKQSAEKIYQIFIDLIKRSNQAKSDDYKFYLFMKADLCRKFLQMGYTRSMRYYYHRSGIKWKKIGNKWIQRPFDYDYEKRISALIFKKYWYLAKDNRTYIDIKSEFMKLTKDDRARIIKKYRL